MSPRGSNQANRANTQSPGMVQEGFKFHSPPTPQLKFIPRAVQQEAIDKSRSKNEPIIIHWESRFFCIMKFQCKCTSEDCDCPKLSTLNSKWKEVIRRRTKGLVRKIEGEGWLVFEFEVGEGGGLGSDSGRTSMQRENSGVSSNPSSRSESPNEDSSPNPNDIRKRRRTYPLCDDDSESGHKSKSRRRRKRITQNCAPTVVEAARAAREDLGFLRPLKNTNKPLTNGSVRGVWKEKKGEGEYGGGGSEYFFEAIHGLSTTPVKQFTQVNKRYTI
ncbi:hypothetical protein TrLO_g14619 [Triparma laevis f. longispina]|uniref:Uncharacterized protein n=1 Tax=Triparma laevis f. longispina TaxID=1714387 RepID=A0A9W7FKJ2_9STRA|nr:hypothetical protein TrLO_g14619 [Triparma laevis f. longispina]